MPDYVGFYQATAELRSENLNLDVLGALSQGIRDALNRGESISENDFDTEAARIGIGRDVLDDVLKAFGIWRNRHISSQEQWSGEEDVDENGNKILRVSRS